jgi:ATP-dependent RNA helicase DDX51/DBP6
MFKVERYDGSVGADGGAAVGAVAPPPSVAAPPTGSKRALELLGRSHRCDDRKQEQPRKGKKRQRPREVAANFSREKPEADGEQVVLIEEESETEENFEKKELAVVAAEWKLDPLLLERLRKNGVTHMFPIQLRVIPDILTAERKHHMMSRRDICVSAPTGSGKTLVFVIGVLQALMRRRVPRLRALVLLPTRELATQVYSVFSSYCEGTPLKVGLAVGQRSMVEEQAALCGASSFASDPVGMARLHGRGHYNWKYMQAKADGGGYSTVDVLVATPGRLLDHLDRTPGFTLQHLRYLVIDEADRLLTQDYHGLIDRIHGAAYQNTAGRVELWKVGDANTPPEFKIDARTHRQHPMALATPAAPAVVASTPLRKMLFSATLTNDAQQLSGLGLVNPVFYSAKERRGQRIPVTVGKAQPPVQSTSQRAMEDMDFDDGDGDVSSQNFTVPAGLSEYTVRCKTRTKPLALIALLRDQKSELVGGGGELSVVFCSSVDSAHRLCRLLQLMGDVGTAVELSSALSAKQRARLLNSASSGKVSVIVCSDSMARGMDVPGVGLVVNYDAPLKAKTYIHRVGRTARAGRRGCAVTMVKRGQEAQFAAVRRQIVGRAAHPLSISLPADLSGKFQLCLDGLRSVLQAEGSGELGAAAPVEAVSDGDGGSGGSKDQGESASSSSSSSTTSSEESEPEEGESDKSGSGSE